MKLFPGGALDEGRLLANARAEVVEFCPADLAAVGHLDLGNAWGVDWEYALDAFAIGDFSHCERGIHTGPAPSDDDAAKDLNALLATFHHSGVDLDGVSNVEVSDLGFKLFLFDLVDDVHGDPPIL